MIKNIDNRKIKEARELLKERKAIPVEGKKLVIETLQSGLKVHYFFLTEEDREIESAAKRKGIKPLYITERLLRSLSELKTPPGQLLIVEPPLWEERRWKKVVVLDKVQDPTNVGSIIRTAYCMGYDAVYSDFQTAHPYTSKVIRVSSGYALKLPFFRIKSLEEELISWAHTMEIIGTFPEGGQPIEGFVPKREFAVIFGNESKGISPKLYPIINRKVSIPMARGDSLSVSASAAIILYHLSKSQSSP